MEAAGFSKPGRDYSTMKMQAASSFETLVPVYHYVSAQKTVLLGSCNTHFRLSVMFLYSQAAGLRAGQVLGALVTLTSALAIAFVFGWKLAFLLMIAVPILVFASYQLALINRRYQRRDAYLMEQAGKVIKIANLELSQ